MAAQYDQDTSHTVSDATNSSGQSIALPAYPESTAPLHHPHEPQETQHQLHDAPHDDLTQNSSGQESFVVLPSTDDQQTSTAMATQQTNTTKAPTTFYSLPKELHEAISSSLELLTDVVSFTIFCVEDKVRCDLKLLLAPFESKLFLNDEFSKEIFGSEEFKYDSRTPREMINRSKPTGYTLPVNIPTEAHFSAMEANGEQARVEKLRYFMSELVKYRKDCVFHSTEYRKDKDSPSWSERGKLGLPLTGPQNGWTFSQFIEEATKSRSINLDEIKAARETAEDKRMEKHEKPERVYLTLERLISDSEFLPDTCRGCGSGKSRYFFRAAQQLKLCEDCFPIHARQNMVTQAMLALYHVDITNFKPSCITYSNIDGQKYISVEDASMITKLHHGLDLKRLRTAVARGELSGDEMAMNSALYQAACGVAMMVEDFMKNDLARSVPNTSLPSFGTWISMHTFGLDNSIVRALAKDSDLEHQPQAFLVSVIQFAKEWVKNVPQRFGLPFEGRKDLVVLAAAEFWSYTLFRSHRLTPYMAFENYHIKQITYFNQWLKGHCRAIDLMTCSFREANFYTKAMYGCPLGLVGQLSPDQRAHGLTVYLLRAAALEFFLRVIGNSYLQQICIDLIAIGLSANMQDVALDDPVTRFELFHEYCMQYLHRLMCSFVQLPAMPIYRELFDVPPGVSQNLANHLAKSMASANEHHMLLSGWRSVFSGKTVVFVASQPVQDAYESYTPGFLSMAKHILNAQFVEERAVPADFQRCEKYGLVAWSP